MKKRLLVLFLLVLSVIVTAAPVAAQEGCTPLLTTTPSGSMWSFYGCSPAEAAEWLAAMEAAPTAASTEEARTEEASDAGPGNVIVTGVPERAENYETSEHRTSLDQFVENGPFISTWPEGLRLVIGFPGVLLTHDEPQAHQDRFSPLTQLPLQGEDVETGCGESRFIKVVAGHATTEFTRANGEVVRVELQHHFGNNHWLYVRCPYSDGAQNSDQGADVYISDFKAGFGHVLLLPEGGYIAEDAEAQALPSTFTGYTAGSEGAEFLTVTALDLNTGAYSVYIRYEDGEWQLVQTNMPLD